MSKHSLDGLSLLEPTQKLKHKNQSPQWEAVFSLVYPEVICGQIKISLMEGLSGTLPKN